MLMIQICFVENISVDSQEMYNLVKILKSGKRFAFLISKTTIPF